MYIYTIMPCCHLHFCSSIVRRCATRARAPPCMQASTPACMHAGRCLHACMQVGACMHACMQASSYTKRHPDKTNAPAAGVCMLYFISCIFHTHTHTHTCSCRSRAHTHAYTYNNNINAPHNVYDTPNDDRCIYRHWNTYGKHSSDITSTYKPTYIAVVVTSILHPHTYI